MEEMINKLVENIYGNFVEDGEFTDFKETNKAFDEVSKYFKSEAKCVDISEELEKNTFALGAAFEKQGFIYGFKKAMEIFEREAV
ncbi:MAG: hypothetical protein Q4D26_09135 [Clostridia bacterium]|nr:hypothetical protein [Clostridia bacterium]